MGMCPTYESTLLLSSMVLMSWPTAPHIGHVIRSSDAKPPAPMSGGFNSSNSDSTSLRWADVDSITSSFSDKSSVNSWIFVSRCNRVLFNSPNCDVNWEISSWAAEALEVKLSISDFKLLISSWLVEVELLASFNWLFKSVIWVSRSVAFCLAVSNSEVKFAIFSSDELNFDSFKAMLFSRSLTFVLVSSNSFFIESFSVVKLVIVWSFSLIVALSSAIVFSRVFWVSSRVFFVSDSSVSVLLSCSFVWVNSVFDSDNCFSRSLTFALRSNKNLPSTESFLSGFDSAFSQSILILFHL